MPGRYESLCNGGLYEATDAGVICDAVRRPTMRFALAGLGRRSHANVIS